MRLSNARFGTLVLVQDGARDVRLRVRTRAEALRLRLPTLALDGVLDPARIGQDTVHVEGGLGREAIFAIPADDLWMHGWRLLGIDPATIVSTPGVH